MDELYDDRRQRMLTSVVTAGARGEKRREWAQPLATAVNNMVRNLINERDIAPEPLDDHAIDVCPVSENEFSQLIQRRGGECCFGNVHQGR